jgi:hypothetical protein
MFAMTKWNRSPCAVGADTLASISHWRPGLMTRHSREATAPAPMLLGLDEIGPDTGENACAKNVGMKADVAGLKARSTSSLDRRNVEAPGVGAYELRCYVTR